MTKQLNFNAPVNTQTGYGVASTNFYLNLVKQGVDVTLWPIGNCNGLAQNKEVLQEGIDKQNNFNPNAPSLRIFHQFSMAESIGRGKRFGMPIFELDQFNDREKCHLKSLDHVIVNTSWAKEVVEKNDILAAPISIVPLGIDPHIFFPVHKKEENTVVFLNVGKWTLNKGHDILKEAFDVAFKEDDDIELWMCCHNHFLSEKEQSEWQNFYKSGKLASKVRIIPWQDTQADLARLMNMADVGVFPSRGEGTNLECMEMLSCGKHIIATNFSGHTEYLTKENASLIDIDRVEPAFDGKWFNGQGSWAYIGPDEVKRLADEMCSMYDTLLNAKSRFNNSGFESMRKYTWERVTRELISVIFE